MSKSTPILVGAAVGIVVAVALNTAGQGHRHVPSAWVYVLAVVAFALVGMAVGQFMGRDKGKTTAAEPGPTAPGAGLAVPENDEVRTSRFVSSERVGSDGLPRPRASDIDVAPISVEVHRERGRS
ncbi:hypothetical protein [Segniliparus rugosus]|uniref:Uncharacterized protein n=1 Tax=Segniliparus rugosus (strain ATCC BAA-974 / DSM 45345 / CCUG 50838 / CIP 108380 / JCM 13579 / CDC 945) TaxID=679197 RepID=E5XLQ7_SEGRC|nr:hypothetical protein [Segniliparus rugosus]EFV14735.1 hypothetical protein HMPREF9336_00426 [Segniliparus rugosus ATCC BAA-974]